MTPTSTSTPIIEQIIKDSPYRLSQFTEEAVFSLNEKIIEKTNSKGKAEPYVNCIVRQKEIKLTPEEVVRQLYTSKLIFDYGYSLHENKKMIA